MTLWNKCQKMAAKLDKIKPGWFKKVNLYSLNMKSCLSCIVGQICDSSFETFNPVKAPDFVKEKWEQDALGWRYSGQYEYKDHYKKLNQYWTTLVKQRKAF